MLKENLIYFLEDNPSHLKEIYLNFPEEKETTIRGRLNENVGKCFKRIKKGVYLAIFGKAQALIIEGNAWKEIKEIGNNTIDTIITDSPYTSINKYLTGTTRKKNIRGKWNFQTRDIDEELLIEMKRVLKEGGHFFSFLPTDNKDTLYPNNKFIETAQKVGFIFNRRWIWNKEVIGMGYNGRSKYEQIIFLSKGKRRKPFDLSIPDLLSHKRISHNKKIHEAQKPNKLINDIIKFSTQEKEIILDTFAGSLVVACESLKSNRDSISIEIDGDMIRKSIQFRKLQGVRCIWDN